MAGKLGKLGQLSHEEYVARVIKRHGNNIIVLGTYTRMKDKILVKHTPSGVEWEVRAGKLLDGTTNAPLNYAKTKTPEQFKEEFNKAANGDYELLSSYKGSSVKVVVKHLECNHMWNITPSDFLSGRRCPQCAKKHKTHEQFVKELKAINPNVEVIGTYKTSRYKLKCKCLICKNDFLKRADNLLLGTHCPCCIGKKLFIGENDLATKRPDLAKLLKDPSLATQYSYNSTKQLTFVCPICGNEVVKKIFKVVIDGLACPCSSKGSSYPNRFMNKLLQQTNYEFTSEFSPIWISPKRYDFCIPTLKLIIEMDGQLGHGNRVFDNSKTIEETIIIDKYKDNKALENGYKMIRINLKYSTKNHLKVNILNSELAKIIDLTNINWEDCDIYAHGSLLRDVCDLWNSGCKSGILISNKLNVHYRTVAKYLRIAESYNLCDYDDNKERKIRKESGNEKLSIIKGTKIQCEQTGEIFNSIAKAQQKYGGNVGYYIRGLQSYAGKLPNGLNCTWRKVINSEEDSEE